MINFLFGFCFCLTVLYIIDCVQSWRISNKRRYNRQSYSSYRKDYAPLQEDRRWLYICNRMTDLEDKWETFKYSNKDLFPEEDFEEED